MSIVPGFQNDLFISYAHRNDTPWREGGVGWVTDFVRTLKAELEAQSREFRIWFDPQLRTGEDFNGAIGQAISESAVFLSILSPAYDDCPYCKKEVAVFREQRHPAFGIKVGTMSRIQAMVLEALPADRWPPELRTTSPCLFYSAGVARFNKPAEPDEKHPYVQGLWKVRDSIWATLEEMRRQKERGVAIEHSYEVRDSEPDGVSAVWLADAGGDLFSKRESLRTALEQLKEFEVRVMSGTEVPSGSAVLPVYLFGTSPGPPATGKDLPLSRLQLEAALAAKPARHPLVWLARDLKPEEAETESHKQFLASLLDRNDIELLRTGFEDLKDEIQRRMRPRSGDGSRTVRRVREDPIVHIWHNIDNATPLVPIRQYLKEKNCGISVFSYAAGPPEKLQSKLAFCDGLIVPYTSATKSWAEDVVTEAFQLRRREERPMAFAAVELPPPSGAEFNFEHARVIPVPGTPTGFTQGIEQFLTKLEEQDV